MISKYIINTPLWISIDNEKKNKKAWLLSIMKKEILSGNENLEIVSTIVVKRYDIKLDLLHFPLMHSHILFRHHVKEIIWPHFLVTFWISIITATFVHLFVAIKMTSAINQKIVWFDSLCHNFSVMLGWVFLSWTRTKQGFMCLAQGHKGVPQAMLEPATIRSRVKPSTTGQLCSIKLLIKIKISQLKSISFLISMNTV